MCKIIGIDISKETFDVGFINDSKWCHFVFENTEKGFRKLLKEVDLTDWIVMEASGPYYLQLALFFYKKQINVSVLNPLIIRRYNQTRLYRAKTDKKDAQTIAEYGAQYDLKKWKPETKSIIEIKQLYTALELIQKEINQSKRQLEAFTSAGVLSKDLATTLKSIIKFLKAKSTKLEQQIEVKAEQFYKSTLERLKSIPGIGTKTAIMLTVITNDFEKFENHKQLIAYVGFSPRLYQSGTSVRGKGHICKMGKSQIRKLMYLYSWSAKRCNPDCVKMYNRLNEKGKPERVIKIALANKLLKQAFSIVKNQTYYSEKFIDKACF
ncbi:transposase [Flavobacterium sp. 28A]|uniref:IS110 family transposase n=1 Tax=Flavobacterium sp. 28A TaxID=2735895 RepID=UPI0015715E46|nr:IS110 family transposase [Flavobacterium sp. 28A]NRT16386.1 transposase [Flavobacterium sp. 28A]